MTSCSWSSCICRRGAALRSPGEMLAAISAAGPRIFGFFLGFVVLGAAALMAHDFSRCAAPAASPAQPSTSGLMAINLASSAVDRRLLALSGLAGSATTEANPASLLLVDGVVARSAQLPDTVTMIHRAARHGHLRAGCRPAGAFAAR